MQIVKNLKGLGVALFGAFDCLRFSKLLALYFASVRQI
jgi:hypothetical protein